MMKKLAICLAAASMTLLTVGCDSSKMNKFFDQVVELKVLNTAPASAAGTLKFYQYATSTHYREVCERYQCGTDTSQSCGTRERCKKVPDGSDDGYKVVCETEHYCDTHHEPRYCQGPCHQEPYTSTQEYVTPSGVTVVVRGAQAGQVEKLFLGVRANANFVAAVQDPSKRPKGTGDLWDDVSASDRTVLVLQAKGLKLKQTSGWISLGGFKRGNSVKIVVDVVGTGSSKSAVSALGASANFPSISF
jgi:hypothetical protein